MGRYKGKSVDKNRLSKKYPYIRAPKRMTFIGDKDLSIELGTLLFQNEISKTLKFEVPFDDSEYNIMLVSRDIGTGQSASVNIYVDNQSSDRTKVTVSASAPFTGEVDVVAIRIR